MIRRAMRASNGLQKFYHDHVACSVLLAAFRHLCSERIDMNLIARSIKANSSLDGVKKSGKHKVRKTKSKQAIVQTSQDHTDIVSPDWMSVVLESPMLADGQVDTDLHQCFKDFVENLDLQYLPSVSTILKKTESKMTQEVLRKWMEAKTEELGGAEQFQLYQKETLNKGLNLHKCIELYLKGERDFTVAEGSQGHWQSIQSTLGEVNEVKMLEVDCVHPEMFYRGKVDCVAKFRDTLCLIEWKTSSKLKPLLSATYDNPIQVAAYLGAVNRSGVLKQLNIPNLTNGALVIAYPTGEPATVHMMSQKVCERYWRQWLNRLYMYWLLQFEEISSV